jgi:hypothetical protein
VEKHSDSRKAFCASTVRVSQSSPGTHCRAKAKETGAGFVVSRGSFSDEGERQRKDWCKVSDRVAEGGLIAAAEREYVPVYSEIVDKFGPATALIFGAMLSDARKTAEQTGQWLSKLSFEDIAKLTGVERSTAWRHVRKMLELGVLLEIKRETPRKNQMRFFVIAEPYRFGDGEAT